MDERSWPAPPAALTSFIGRSSELDAVGALLRSQRVVSVLGPGGSGKTRLAWELVRGRHASGGLWCFTELVDDVSSAAQVAERVAAALGLPVGAGRDALEELCAGVQDEDVLVALDGCERAVEPIAEAVACLVASCPALSVLVTSREPLSVAGEALYRLPPMALPRQDDLADRHAFTADDDELVSADAVALFVERSRWSPELLSQTERLLVVEICRELDGAPLAIELAAARLDHVELTDVAQGLSDRFALLSRGPRSAPARHRTIEACIDWSHDLLGDADRAAFRRLSVFTGPFGLAAATAVAGWPPLDQADVTAAVSRLVDRSLVERAPAGPDGTARYRLLATLRAYARRRLEAADEAAATSERHLVWWCRLGTEAAHALEGADAPTWLARLRAEVDDLRAALGYAADAADWAAHADLISALTLFWHGSGLHREGLRLAELGLAEHGLAELDHDEHRLDLLHWTVGYLALQLGDLDRAALAADRDPVDERVHGRVLDVAGSTAVWTDPVRARPMLDRAVAVARSAGDTWCELDAAQRHAYSWLMQDRWVPASAEVEALAERVEALGNPFFIASQCYVRTQDAVYRGELQLALQHGARLATASEATGDPASIAFAACVLTEAALLAGDLDAARTRLCWGREAAGRWVDGTIAGSVLDLTEAVLTLAAGPDPAALDVLLTAAGAYRTIGAVSAEALTLHFLAEAAHTNGAFATVRSTAARLAAIGAQLDNRRCTAMHDLWTGMADLATGRPDLALGELLSAAELLIGEGFEPDAVRALHAAASASAALGRPAIGARVLGAADAARRRNGWAGLLARPADRLVDASVATAAGDRYEAFHREGTTLSLPEAARLLRRSRSTRKRPATGWPSLTDTERQVVDLVVTGASNPEIGTRLFITRSTVKTHLASIYRKLELSSRAQLAATAVTHASGPAEPTARIQHP